MNGFKMFQTWPKFGNCMFLFCFADGKWLHHLDIKYATGKQVSYNLLMFDLQTIDINQQHNQHGKASNIQALALPFSWSHPYVFVLFF